MSIKNQKDFWSGVMFSAFGLFFVVFSQDYPMGSASRMGPAYFPMLLGGLLALLGAVVAFKGFVTRPTDGGDGRVGRFDWRAVLLVLGAVLLFAVLLKPAGLVLAMTALIAVASLGSEEVRLKEVIALALVMGGIVWAVFIVGLKLTIPVWPAFLSA